MIPIASLVPFFCGELAQGKSDSAYKGGVSFGRGRSHGRYCGPVCGRWGFRRSGVRGGGGVQMEIYRYALAKREG